MSEDSLLFGAMEVCERVPWGAPTSDSGGQVRTTSSVKLMRGPSFVRGIRRETAPGNPAQLPEGSEVAQQQPLRLPPEGKRIPVPDALRWYLEGVLELYPEASSHGMRGSWVAHWIRRSIPEVLGRLTPNSDTYKIVGSAGKGNWAACPWVAVLDPDVTMTPQSGFYLVYLFSERMDRVYLSLNQGVTQLRAEYGDAVARRLLPVRAALMADMLSLGGFERIDKGSLQLGSESMSAISAFYSAGNIGAIEYDASRLPDGLQLARDYLMMLELYGSLALRWDANDEMSRSVDAVQQTEDLRKHRAHWRLDRNQALVDKVKRVQGTRCRVCGFDFEEVYGDLGKGFIEAHHLTPISELAGRVVSRDPQTDFAVLCSNCHSMIHRQESPDDLDSLRQRLRPFS